MAQEKIVSSLHNPEVMLISKLADRKYREQSGLFVAEGVRSCTTLLQAGMCLKWVCVTEFAVVKKLSVHIPREKIRVVTEPVMKKLSQATTASGVLCVFEMPPQPAIEYFSNGVVLVSIADPGNVGTLIRTAAAMNLKTVVCVEGADPFGFKCVQASAGAIGQVHIFKMTWQEVTECARAHKMNLVALVSRDGKDPQQVKYERTLLVVGSEAVGLSPEMINDCAQRMTIPMPGNTESLNAAIAGSIAMYLARSSDFAVAKK